MVEDNYKIGISLELEQSSLADIQKQIEKTIATATQGALGNVDLGAVPGSNSIKSAQSSIGVKGGDFPKAIQSIMKSEFKTFENAVAQMTQSVEKLTTAIDKQSRMDKISPSSASGEPRGEKREMTGSEKALAALGSQLRFINKHTANGRNETTQTSAARQRIAGKMDKIANQPARLSARDSKAQRAADKDNIKATKNLTAVKNEEAAAHRNYINRLNKDAVGFGGFSAPRDPLQSTKSRPTVGGTQQNQKAQSVSRATTGGREEPAGSLVAPVKAPHRTGDGPTDNAGRAQAALRQKQATIQAKTAEAQANPPKPPGPVVPATPGGPRRHVDYQKQAENDAKAAANTLNKFVENLIKHLPNYKDEDVRGIFNIPRGEDINVREGAATTIKSAGGKERHIGAVVKIDGESMTRIDRISHSMEGTEGELKKIAAAARRRPGSEVNAIQKLVRKRIFEKAPAYESHTSHGAMMKAGEAQMIYTPSQAQAERITTAGGSKTNIGAAHIGEVEAVLFEMARASRSFVDAGADVVSVLGTTEEHAAKMASKENWKLKQNRNTEAWEGTITGKMQTRQVQQFQTGGPGLGKQARTSFMKGFSKIEGGERPVVMSPFHKEMLDKGHVAPSARNLKTAAMSAKHIPELLEDQSLITKSAAREMGMSKEHTKLVKTPEESLQVGMQLQDKQAMGINAAGKAVEMALHGASAQIVRMKEVTKNGVAMMAITYEEFNAPGTGMKGTTLPGNKSMFKVVEDEYMAKVGAPEGTEVLTSIEGMARRGDLQDPVTMIATSMAEGSKIAAQTIFDAIVKGMDNGADMLTAATAAGEEFGIDPNKAMQDTRGAMKAGGINKALTGQLPWYRLEKEGMTGPGEMKDRYMDPISNSALQQRQETLAYAMAAQERSHKYVTAKQEDYHKVLLGLTGATSEITSGLRKMNVEDFAKLPSGYAEPEKFKGTIADKEYQEGAFNLQVPKFEGGMEDFYMPGMGHAVGQRGAFETEEGLAQSTDLTRAFEMFRTTGLDIKAARGELDIKESPEAQMEGAEFVNRTMQDQIKAISGMKGDEKEAASKEFNKQWLPVIRKMSKEGMSAGIQWMKRDKKGNETLEDFESQPIKYANLKHTKGEKKGELLGGEYGRALRTRDMIGLRASGEWTKKGTKAIGSSGGAFKDLDILELAMKKIGTSVADSPTHMKDLWEKHEGAREKLLDATAEQGFGKAGTPSREELRRVSQTRGSGLMQDSMYTKAIEFNVDIEKDLEYAERQLRQIGEAGGDVGDALSALEKIRAMNVSEDVIPRDAVMLSKTDFANMKAAIKRDAKREGKPIDDEEAERRMQRGITARFPITGGESHQVTRFLEDKKGVLPEGKIGIPGTFASPGTEATKTMRAPLEALRDSFVDIIKVNNGFGTAADEARAKLKEINPVLDSLTSTFHKSSMNLDFDGDNIIAHAANSAQAADQLRTSVEVLKSFGFSGQNALRTSLGSLESADLDFESLKGINDSFGIIAKGRPKELGARPVPDDANTARREAMGLTGGKLSVGLLSDAFNIFHEAVVGGSKLTGDAFATAKDFMMLNINKSLAAKHGGGDAAGPLELLDLIKKGPKGIAAIEKGMDAGDEGVLGEMGDQNAKMRKAMEAQLPSLPIADLAALAMKEGLLKEGEGLTSANFNQTIAALIDKMDFKGQIKEIWNKIEANLRESLTKKGLSGPAIDEYVEKATTRNKKGFIEGVDLRELTPEAFQLSKKKGADKLREDTPMERARAVIDANFEDLNIQPDDPKKLSSDLESWVAGVKGLVGILSDDDIRMMGRDPADVGGMYNEPPGTTPGEGAIMVGETSRIKPMMAALEAVRRGEAGTLSDSANVRGNILNKSEDAIRNMADTVGHEYIHQGSKVEGTAANRARNRISDQLMSGEGDFGGARDEIFAGANKLGAVGKQAEIYKELQMAAMFGDDEGQTIIGDDIGGGQFSGMTADDATAKQGQKYMDMVAEELLAHLANPERWMEIFSTVPEGVKAVLGPMFGGIKEEMSAIFTPLEQGSAEIISRMQALRGGAPPEAAAVRKEALARMEPDEELMAAGGQMKHIESILRKGREDYNLSVGARETPHSLLATRDPVDLPLQSVVGIDTTTDLLRKSLGEMATGDGMGLGTQEMVDKRADYKAGAEMYRRQVEAEPEEAGGGWKGGEKAYTKAMQEFQAAELQMYVNRAKTLEDVANDLRSRGLDKGPEFRAIMEDLDDTIKKARTNLSQLGYRGSKGDQGLAMERSTRSLREEAYLPQGAGGLGLAPDKQNYMDIVSKQGPREHKAKKAYMEGFGEELLEANTLAQAGMQQTKIWDTLWQQLESRPGQFSENLSRTASVLQQFGKNYHAAFGFDDDRTRGMLAMAERAAKTSKAATEAESQGLDVNSPEGIARLKATSKPVAQAAFSGKDLKDTMQSQKDSIQAEKEQWEANLNAMLKAGVKPAGGKHLDRGKQFAITGPDGTAIQKFNMTAKKGMDGYKVSIKEATAAANGLTGSVRNSLRRVVQWGFATGIVYGTIRAFRQMIQVVTEVETKIAGLKKVMDVSVTNFEKMQDSAAGFAQEFGVSIEDVLDGMVVYGQQGLKVNKIMERTRATMLAVNVTTLSSVQATEALTAAHKVFGDSVSGSTQFVDAWAAVAARHAITAADLADAVKRSGAAAQVAGVGFSDFMGIVTAIGAVTRQTGKEVATGTKFMFRAMRRPTAQKELAGMGVQSLESGGDFRPAMDIMGELAGKWDTLTRAQQVNMAQAMAGIRHYNAFIVLMNNFDEALLASADASNSQGFAMRKNRLTMATFSKQMSKMQESVKGLVLEMGKSVLPIGTDLVKVLTGVVGAITAIPTGMSKAVMWTSVLGLAFHKTADLISDSIDAMSSGNVNMGPKTGFGGSAVFEKVSGGMTSMKEGWKAAGAAGDTGHAADGLSKLGSVAKGARTALMGVGKGAIYLASGATSVIPALKGVTTAMRAMSAAMITTVGGAVIVALGVALVYAYKWYQKATQSAKEFEQSQEGVIGRSEDAATTLRTQLVHAQRLGLAYIKIGQATDAMGDAGGMSAALAEGRFKGAATAAQKYSNMLADIGNNLGKADPTQVTGISDTGDLIVSIEDNFKSMTQAALDAQNAVTFALKAETIAAYASELNKTLSIWDRMAESINKAQNAFMGMFGGEKGDLQTDMSAMGDLKQTTKEIKQITDARRKQAQEGGYMLTGEAKLIELVKRRGEEEQKVLSIAMETRRIFESMPAFGDLGTAMNQITPKFEADIAASVETGAFGRGATLDSVMKQFMGKQAGLGGILDYQNTQSAGLTANAFLERGIRTQTNEDGSPATTPDSANQIGILSKSAADNITGGVQTLFSTFDAATGKLVWSFRSSSGRVRSITSEAIDEVGRSLQAQSGGVADHFITWTKKEVEAASEATKRLLTTQYTGALAGVRLPSGGMPNMGPSRNAELTLEQRVMKSLPDDIQRLSDIQKEYNALGKEYSEILLGDAKGAYTSAGQAAKELKVATQDVLELAVRLQKEGFNLSVIANYEKMQHKLAQTMEQSARAAEDYESAERNKNKYLTAPAGAMAGMGAIPTLDLGKAFKELSGLEKLSIETPGFGATLRNVDSKAKERERNVGTLNELEKQLKDFNEATADMKAAGESLDEAGNKKILTALKEGASKGQRAMIKALNQDAVKQLGISTKQLGVQQRMLDQLGALVDLAGTPEEDRQAKYAEILNSRSYDDLMTGYGSVTQGAGMNEAQREALGIVDDGTGRFKTSQDSEGVDAEKIERIVALINGIADRDKYLTAAKGIDPKTGRENRLFQGEQGRFAIKTNGPDSNFAGNESFMGMEAAQIELGRELKAVFVESGDRLKTLRAEIINQTSLEASSDAGKADAVAKANARIEDSRIAALEAENATRKSINDKIREIQSGLDDGNTELGKISQEIKFAQSARDLATSLKDMVKEFKKAEAAVVIKLKSDLEGPFARVGKPGFQTDFEKRREDLKAGSSRPMSLDQMRQRDKDKKQLKWDEDEAKVKQAQAIETAALKRQQQRAEQVRSKMQDVMGNENIDEDTRAKAKSFFETLGSELATSEQAEMRGKDLYFKGIPSLGDLEGLANQIAADANKQAKDIKTMDLIDVQKKGNVDVVTAMNEDTKVARLSLLALKAIEKSITGTNAVPTDTGPVATSDLGATDSNTPRGNSSSDSVVAPRASTSTARSAAGSSSDRGMSRQEIDAYKAHYERIDPNRKPGAKEAGIGVGGAAALALARPDQAKAAVGITTKMGKVVNSVESVADDLVIAMTKLEATGEVIGRQVFDVIEEQDGTKRLKGRHISDGSMDWDMLGGKDLPPDAQGAGVGPDRVGKVIDYAQEQGMSDVRFNSSQTRAQNSAISKAAHSRGLTAEIMEGTTISTDKMTNNDLYPEDYTRDARHTIARGERGKPSAGLSDDIEYAGRSMDIERNRIGIGDEDGVRVRLDRPETPEQMQNRARRMQQSRDRARFDSPEALDSRIEYSAQQKGTSHLQMGKDGIHPLDIEPYPEQGFKRPTVEPDFTDPRYVPGKQGLGTMEPRELRASLDAVQSRSATTGDAGYQDAVHRINNPLDVEEIPGRALSQAELDIALDDARKPSARQIIGKAKDPLLGDAIDSYKRPGSAVDPYADTSLAGMEAEVQAKADAVAKQRAMEADLKQVDEHFSSKRAASRNPFGEGAAMGDDALDAAADFNPNAKPRPITPLPESATGPTKAPAKPSTVTSVVDAAEPSWMKRFSKSAGVVGKAVAIPAALAEVSEVLDIFGSAGLKEDATEEGDRLGGVALITALGGLTLALASLPMTIAAGVTVAAAAGSDAFLGTDIINTGGKFVNELSGGTMTDVAKAGGDWGNELYGNKTAGVDFGSGTDSSTGLEDPAVTAHRAFLRNRTDATDTRSTNDINLTADDGMGAAPADDVARHREFLRNRTMGGPQTRSGAVINDGKDPNALAMGAAPQDDVNRQRQFLRDRAAGLLPADATRNSGQINQTSTAASSTINPLATPLVPAAPAAAVAAAAAPTDWDAVVNKSLLDAGIDPATIGQKIGPGMGPGMLETMRNPSQTVPGAADVVKPNYAAMYQRGPSSPSGSAFDDPTALYNQSMAASQAGKMVDLTTDPPPSYDREMSTGLSDSEKMVGVRKALSAGATTYSSYSDKKATGEASLLGPGYDPKGKDTVDLNASLRRMQEARNPQTAQPLPEPPQAPGANAALVAGAKNKRELVQAPVAGAPSPDQRAARQELSKEKSSEGGNEGLSKAIASLNDKLEGLSDLKIDTTELSTSIAGIGPAVGTALSGKTLDVNITNQSLDVSVSNFPATTATTEPSATGADVTKLATAIDAIAGLQTLHKTDIAAHETRLKTVETTSSDNAGELAVVKTEAAKITPEAVAAQVATATAAITDSVTAVDTRITELDGKLTPINTEAARIAGLADEAKTSADGFKKEIETARDKSIEAEVAATAAKVTAGEAVDSAKVANSTADAAKATAEAAKDSVATLDGVVASNKTAADNAATDIRGKAQSLTKRVSANEGSIGKLQQAVVVADTKAGQALAKP